MSPVEREIITAKHHHGLKPSQIARLLEMPVRQVVTVTGSLPIVRKMTEQAIREAMGSREFRVGDLAEAFGAEHATAGAHIRALEAKGRAYRAGEKLVAHGVKATVWKLRGIVMTDLVQKIADAVWARIIVPDLYEKADIQVVIRQALADAGGAVAWLINDPDTLLGGGSWLLDSEQEALYAKGAGCEVRALYTHPDSGRVAELERVKAEQLAKIGDLLRRNTTIEAQLAASESDLSLMRSEFSKASQQLTASRARETDWMSTAAAMLNATYEQRKALFESTCANYCAAIAADKEKNDEG